mmetsp:Transcript_3820/g.5202  ORF Transcript_3820/g.5202 Transcript_3820/m.5202 type:complete len:86 (+) Transcript_3820:386-643(+)
MDAKDLHVSMNTVYLGIIIPVKIVNAFLNLQQMLDKDSHYNVPIMRIKKEFFQMKDSFLSSTQTTPHFPSLIVICNIYFSIYKHY